MEAHRLRRLCEAMNVEPPGREAAEESAEYPTALLQ